LRTRLVYWQLVCWVSLKDPNICPDVNHRWFEAVGTVESLAARYPSYEVHFTCRTRDAATKAQQIMSTIPGAKMADDVATRFEVPVNAEGSEHRMTLLELFHALSSRGEFTEYTVERSTLETAFLKVIRENQVAEEDAEGGRKRKGSWFTRWLS